MSLSAKFTGTGIAIVTPFLNNKQIDLECFRKLINFWIEGGVDYLVVLGTTGESATIHGEEKQQVFSFVREVNAGRLPLVAGIGGNDTYVVLQEFKKFDLKDYDAILSVGPYYNKPTQEGIFQHYNLLNEKTPLPVIMYNVPSRTGQNITAETQLRIANECKNIFATKEASGDFNQVMQIIKYKPADFMVISGDDALTLPMIACGAEGLISVVANAYPKDYADMVRLCLAGKFTEAQQLHYKYIDVITSLFTEGSPGGIKEYLSEMGLCSHAVRLPAWPVSEKHHTKIKELIKSI